MKTAVLDTTVQGFAKTDAFDGSLDLYYRYELDARYDYLIDNDLVEVNRQEYLTLRSLLLNVPSADGATPTEIVNERLVHKYCAALVKNNLCKENILISKYFDIDAVVAIIVKDLPTVEVNGKAFYWINCAFFFLS